METAERGRGVDDEGGFEVDTTPLTVMLLLLAVAAVQFVHYYAKLPEVLATHFGASGAPDGWSDKRTFFLIYGIIEVAIVAGALLLSRFAWRIPTATLNVPNKDYWLAPERRAESLRFAWSQILWIEAATLAFLIVVAEVVFRTNLGTELPVLNVGDLMVVLVAFVAVTVWIAARIFVRFRLPRPERGRD